jgi:hypothetical protein
MKKSFLSESAARITCIIIIVRSLKIFNLKLKKLQYRFSFPDTVFGITGKGNNTETDFRLIRSAGKYYMEDDMESSIHLDRKEEYTY